MAVTPIQVADSLDPRAHDVFLSLAAADRAAALTVLDGLERVGIRCWIAPCDIPAGSEYGQKIVDAVKGCRVFLVVFSSSANASPQVRRDVERAAAAAMGIIATACAEVPARDRSGGADAGAGRRVSHDLVPSPSEG